MRSFVAVEINDQRILDRIIQVQQRLLMTGGDLRVVQPQNIHVTIRFLGEIPASLVDEVRNIMSRVSFKPFHVKLEGVGVFPNERRPNVLWIGITEGVRELREIHSQLESGFRAIGLSPDNKGFSPHITVARVRSRKNQESLSGLVLEMNATEIGAIDVTEFVLKRSVLTPQGPIYSRILAKAANGTSGMP
ncbi:MAG: RNA 2',3'-cyclic phosphodiesterase [archaeon]